MSIISRLKEFFMATKKKSDDAIDVEVEAPAEEPTADKSGIYYTIASNDNPPEKVEPLIVKTKRRAQRFFNGREVKHRVARKEAGKLIEFAYFRRSGKPVKIAWHNRKAG